MKKQKLLKEALIRALYGGTIRYSQAADVSRLLVRSAESGRPEGQKKS